MSKKPIDSPSSPSSTTTPMAMDRPQLERKLGRYGSFLDEMLHRMPTIGVPSAKDSGAEILPLARVRTDDDGRNFIYGVTSAVAAMLDVLSFYQDRITNDTRISTTNSSRAKVDLARSVNHGLAPATSSSAFLAFTATNPPGQTGTIFINGGVAVQSLVPPTASPSDGPQVFESVESISVRPEWNVMTLKLPPTSPAKIEMPTGASESTVTLTVQSPVVPMKPGDDAALVGTDENGSATSIVTKVDTATMSASGTTRLSLLVPDEQPGTSITSPTLLRFRRSAAILGASAANWSTLGVDGKRQYGWIRGGPNLLSLVPEQPSTSWTRAPIYNGLPTDTVIAALPHPGGRMLALVQGKGVYAAKLDDLAKLAKALEDSRADAPQSTLPEPWVGMPTDYSAPWSPAMNGLTRRDVTCMGMDSDGVVYVGALGGGIYRSVDGTNWDDISRGPTFVEQKPALRTVSFSLPPVTVIAVAAGWVLAKPNTTAGEKPADAKPTTIVTEGVDAIVEVALSEAGINLPKTVVDTFIKSLVGKLASGGGADGGSKKTSDGHVVVYVVLAATTTGLYVQFDGDSAWYLATGIPADALLTAVAIDERTGIAYVGTNKGGFELNFAPTKSPLVELTDPTDPTKLSTVAFADKPTITGAVTQIVAASKGRVAAPQVSSAPKMVLIAGTVIFGVDAKGLVDANNNIICEGNKDQKDHRVTALSIWPSWFLRSFDTTPTPIPCIAQIDGKLYYSSDTGQAFVELNVSPAPLQNSAGGMATVSALSLFANSSMQPVLLAAQPYMGFDPDEWPGMALEGNELDLSSVDTAIVPSSFILLSAAPSPYPTTSKAASPTAVTLASANVLVVGSANTATVTRFGATQKVTHIVLQSLDGKDANVSTFSPRTTIGHVGSEVVRLMKSTPEPASDAITTQPQGPTTSASKNADPAMRTSKAVVNGNGPPPESNATTTNSESSSDMLPSISTKNMLQLATPIPAIANGRKFIVQGKLLRANVADDAPLRRVTPGASASDAADVKPFPSPLFVVDMSGDSTSTLRYVFIDSDGQKYTLETPIPSIVTLEFSQPDDPSYAEVVEGLVDEQAPPIGMISTLMLKDPLTRAYETGTVKIFGNVAEASHGVTVSDIALGSGNASMAFQQFVLPQKNLTQSKSDPESPPSTTLIVAVNGVPWTEVSDLSASTPTETAYSLQYDADGTVTVCFGDGVHGARLPTGTNNVTATYRTGSGPTGHLAPNTLSVLLRHPLGLIGVTNPIATSETTPTESPNDAIQYIVRAGQVARTIVTPDDYAYLTHAYPGVAKVHVTLTTSSGQRKARVTISRTPGTSLGPKDDIAFAQSLTEFLESRRLASERRVVKLMVRIALTKYFGVVVQLARANGSAGDQCGTGVADGLAAAFSFGNTQLGKHVELAQVVSVIQGTAGVAGVSVKAFDYVAGENAPAPSTDGAQPLSVPPRLSATNNDNDQMPFLLLFGGPRSVIIDTTS